MALKKTALTRQVTTASEAETAVPFSRLSSKSSQVAAERPLLIVKSCEGDAAAVRELLDEGERPDLCEPTSGWTSLMYAACLGKVDCMKALIAGGADVNHIARPYDWSAFTAAVLADQEAAISVLIDAGADVNAMKRRHPELRESYIAALEKHRTLRQACECPAKECSCYVSDYSVYV